MHALCGTVVHARGIVRNLVGNRERHFVEVDIPHQILELAVQRIIRILGVDAINAHVGGSRRHRTGRVSMEIAVLRIGLGPRNTHISSTNAFESRQSLAHQLADGGILLGHGLFQTNRIDMHRHTLYARIGAKTQRGHHQPNTQIVVRAHAGTFGVRHIHPCVAGHVIFGGWHHGNAGRGETDGHIAVLEAASEVHVEAVWQAHAAQ